MHERSHPATDVDELRSKAARCRRLAKLTPDAPASDALLTLARESEAMVAQAVAEARAKVRRDLA